MRVNCRALRQTSDSLLLCEICLVFPVFLRQDLRIAYATSNPASQLPVPGKFLAAVWLIALGSEHQRCGQWMVHMQSLDNLEA